MIDATSNSLCCGCGACKSVCPQHCITMVKSDEGFYYPHINEDNCIKCNLCSSTCPSLNYNNKAEPPAVYAAINLDEVIRLRSSSGGIFYLIAESIIKRKGIVYGVALTNGCREAKHIRIDNLKDLHKALGSKYVQASPIEYYEQIRKELNEGLWVCFSGTPCQISALKLYLKRDYDKLLCVDVVCHGVPSQLLWEKYLDYMERKMKAPIVNVDFRSKQRGWQQFGISKSLQNGKEYYSPRDVDPYMYFFLRNKALRNSCYQCNTKNGYYSDISLADFWGIKNVLPEYEDGKGVSLVLVRTKKGAELFDELFTAIKMQQVNYEDVIHYNSAEYSSPDFPKQRESFYKELKKYSFGLFVLKQGKDIYITKVKKTIKKIIGGGGVK